MPPFMDSPILSAMFSIDDKIDSMTNHFPYRMDTRLSADSGFNGTVPYYPHIPPQPPPRIHPTRPSSSTYYPPHQPSFPYATLASHPDTAMAPPLPQCNHYPPQQSYYPQPPTAHFTQPNPYTLPSPDPCSPPTSSSTLKLTKFSGSDPNFWLLNTELYFLQHPWPLETRFDFILLHLEGFALTWFKLWRHQLDSWEKFREVFNVQFIQFRSEHIAASRKSEKTTVVVPPRKGETVSHDELETTTAPQHNSKVLSVDASHVISEKHSETTLTFEAKAIVEPHTPSSQVLQSSTAILAQHHVQDRQNLSTSWEESHDLLPIQGATQVIRSDCFSKEFGTKSIFTSSDIVSKSAHNLFEKMHELHDIDIYTDSFPGLSNHTFDPGIFHATYFQACGNFAMPHNSGGNTRVTFLCLVTPGFLTFLREKNLKLNVVTPWDIACE